MNNNNITNINMANKKVLNFIKSVLYLRDGVIKGYEKKFDEAIKLYESRKIEKQTTLTSIIYGLRYKPQLDKSLKSLQKYSTMNQQSELKKPVQYITQREKINSFILYLKLHYLLNISQEKRRNKLKSIMKYFQNQELLPQKH